MVLLFHTNYTAVVAAYVVVVAIVAVADAGYDGVVDDGGGDGGEPSVDLHKSVQSHHLNLHRQSLLPLLHNGFASINSLRSLAVRP